MRGRQTSAPWLPAPLFFHGCQMSKSMVEIEVANPNNAALFSMRLTAGSAAGSMRDCCRPAAAQPCWHRVGLSRSPGR